MNKADRRVEEIEQLLRRARLAGPPEELKTRIVGVARETWDKAPADIPWRVPLRHLAVSAAAAVLIVSSANYFSLRMVASWQTGRPVATRVEAAAFEDMPPVPYSPLVRQFLATGRSSGQDVTALLDYMKRVRETLNGTEQDDSTQRSEPGERESRLLPAGSKVELYS